MDGTARGVRDRLRAALAPAMRARDTAAVAALRSALATLDNATAVPRPPTPAPGAGATGPAGEADGSGSGRAGTDLGAGVTSVHVAGAVAGVGAAEVARRELTEAEQVALVRAEITDRETAAAAADRSGHPAHAARLRAEATALTPHLP